jgi:Domain of unknown function (DUF4347)
MATVDVTVVDRATDPANTIARQTYPDSIPVYSVQSMVDAIINRLNAVARQGPTEPAVIGRLRIVGHGQPGLQGVGDSQTTRNPRQLLGLDRHGHLMHRGVLMQLRGRFASNGRVDLHGCQVGRGREGAALLHQLKALWGVPVYASTIDQNPATPSLDYLVPVRPHR